MKLKNYVEHTPERILSNVNAITRKRLVKTIITPTIFHASNDKILFVGDLKRRLLKIPNQRTDLCYEDNIFDLDKRVKQLASFCFSNSGGVIETDYLGLIRHKSHDKTLILPVIATLEDRSDSPWLEPGSNWLEKTNNNRDHMWVDVSDCSRLIDGPDFDMLTENTAGIVDYFQKTRTKYSV